VEGHVQKLSLSTITATLVALVMAPSMAEAGKIGGVFAGVPASQAAETCALDAEMTALPGRSLARPVACTFTNPRGSFGTTTPAPTPTPTPPVAVSNDPATTPPAGPSGTMAYYAPGELLPQDKGRGRVGDRKIYLPGIVYPLKLATGMEVAPAGRHPHMNSQIWGYGGGGWNGRGAAGGTECDKRNYNPMLQRDNYCEVRGWDMPMCPSGQGHQGQDIRPPACEDDKWDAVAVVDGTITQVTSNTTVRLKGGDGTEYYYLHMHPDSITVEEGSVVKQGQVLGRVSNFMNGGRETTHHLHFQVKQSISIGGSVQRVYVPVFSSLVAAYRKAKGLDPGVDDKGNLIADAGYEIGAKPADAPKPAFTLWPVPNVAASDGRVIEPVNLARAFRPSDDKAKVTYVATGLPPGLSLDSTTGFITGKIGTQASRTASNGVYTVVATATDNKGAKANQSFTITAASSAPIVATPTAAKTFREGEAVVIAAGSAFTDPNLDALTYAVEALPDGLTLDPATGRISGTLAAGTAVGKPDGIYVINMSATDSVDGTATQSFTLTVLPAKKPDPPAVPAPQIVGPIPQGSAFAGQEFPAFDSARYFKPAAGDTSPLQYAASGLPPGLAIDGATGQITGLLPQSAADGNGQFPIVVTVTSAAGGKTSQSFLLTVRNQAPALVTRTVNKTFVEGESVIINAGGAFSTPPGSILKFAATGLPAGLSFDPENGTITGVLPAGSAQGGTNGVYTVAVAASDQRGAAASQTFIIAVTPPPPKPEAPAVIKALAPVTAKDGERFGPLDVSSSFKVAGTVGSTGPLQFSALGLPDALTIDAKTGVISGALAAAASQASPGGNYLVTVFATDLSNGLKSTLGLVMTIQAQAPPAPSPPAPTTPTVTPPPAPTPATPPPATPQPTDQQGWWPWIKDKVSGAASGAWGWATK
jgi:murein DD-endopeptidase MepM/ murein hydrolase activator NlpD